MKKTSTTSKLNVNRETLRSLTDDMLGAVRGASANGHCMTSGSNGSKTTSTRPGISGTCTTLQEQ